MQTIVCIWALGIGVLKMAFRFMIKKRIKVVIFSGKLKISQIHISFKMKYF